MKKMVESAITSAAGGDVLRLLSETQMGDSNAISHTIFQISPTNADTDTDTGRLLSHSKYEAVSRWALDLLLRYYEAGKAHVIADFYSSLVVVPGAAPLRGHLFERQVFSYMDGVRTGHTFSIRGLADSEQAHTWNYRGSIQRITFQETTVFKEISEAVHHLKPRHLVPFERNLPAMDSILYDPDDPDAVITCIQITMNKDHAIAVSGLRRLQRWFKAGSPLESLRPTNAKPWRLLFVVPSHMEGTFKSQKLKDDTASNVWAGKVHQYVLGLEERTIFRSMDPI